MTTVLGEYKKFVKDLGESPVMVMADDEFSAKAFVDYNEGLGVDLYTDIAKDDHRVGNSDRLGIVDRFCGTIKQKLKVHQKMEGRPGQWMFFIPDFIQAYNNTEHTTLSSRMHTAVTPNQAFDLPETVKQSISTSENQLNQVIDSNQEKFAIGSRVRVLRARDVFDKKSQRWSDAIYTVTGQQGYKYIVSNGKLYKPQEMLLAKTAPGRGSSAAQVVVNKEARSRRTNAREGIPVDEKVLRAKEAPTTRVTRSHRPYNTRGSKP
jgi:hypothetical protein